MTQTYTVLSIDAWGNNEDGYEWNAWYRVGHYDGDIDNDKEILAFFSSYVDDVSLCYVEDDGYNIILYVTETNEPLYAIEYGSTI